MTNMHITKLSGKLDGFRSLSSNTTTNPFCIKMNATTKDNIICKECYSMSMLKGFRKNAAPALQRNNDLLASRILEPHEIPTIIDMYFRIHTHGEILNLTHAINILNLVKANPHTTFGWWSKRKDIINKLFSPSYGGFGFKKPSNLIMIYNNPKIDDVIDTPPKWFDKTFNNVTSHPAENCTGQRCKDCLVCYTHNDTNTIIEKVK